MATKNNTATNVTFTTVATVLIPTGVGLLTTNAFLAVVTLVLGVGCLVLREVFKK